MTRRSRSLLPLVNSMLMAASLFAPLAFAQEAEWDVSQRIATSVDDSEEFLASSANDPQRWPAGFSYAESSDLELGRDAGHAPQIVGLRFPNLQIPQGAQISQAVLEFTADSDQSAPLTVTIEVQDAAAAEPFIQDQDGQGSFDLSSRQTLGASQNWDPEAWSAGQPYRSPDIAGLVQQLVASEGWQPGGSVVLLIRPGATAGEGFRSAHAFDSNPQLAPRLLVSYEGGDAVGEPAPGAEPVEPARAEPEQDEPQRPEPVEPEQAAEEPEEPAEPERAEPEPAPAEPAPAEPAPEPEVAEEGADEDRAEGEQQESDEVVVRPVDPDPILTPEGEERAPSVWPGPVDEQEQPEVAQPAEPEEAGEVAEAPVQPEAEREPGRVRDEPRRARFPLVPNFSGGLEGSVLLSDYGGGVTVITVFLDNPAPEVTYLAAIREGECGSSGRLVVDLPPIPGSKALSTQLLDRGFDELREGEYQLRITRTSADFVRIAACAAIGDG